MTRHTSSHATYSPEDAARVLRLNVHSIYRALRRNEIPHKMVGPYYRIPCQFLLMDPPPVPKVLSQEVPGQLALDLGVPLIPVRVWRNRDGLPNGGRISPWSYDNRTAGFSR